MLNIRGFSDTEKQEKCDNACTDKFLGCLGACTESACNSACNREFFACSDSCPCNAGCPNGCQERLFIKSFSFCIFS